MSQMQVHDDATLMRVKVQSISFIPLPTSSTLRVACRERSRVKKERERERESARCLLSLNQNLNHSYNLLLQFKYSLGTNQYIELICVSNGVYFCAPTTNGCILLWKAFISLHLIKMPNWVGCFKIAIDFMVKI